MSFHLTLDKKKVSKRYIFLISWEMNKDPKMCSHKCRGALID